MTIRVATFNIRNGRAWDGRNSWPFRRRSTAAAIVRMQVDLIGLQEVYEFQRRYLVRRIHGTWVGTGRLGSRKGEQCPLVVLGDRVEMIDHVTRWYGDTEDKPGSRLPGASFPRIATLVTCRETSSGTPFLVINTHLDEHLAGNRAAAVAQIARWIDDDFPTIVMGDFNTTPDDEEIVRPVVERGFEIARINGATNHDYSDTANRWIDHIWFSPHWTITDAAVVTDKPHGRFPSDHWPVRATAYLSDVRQ
jgi:endonuclease/exonuclease/phosphatase family metal-dependent hydrolase